MSKALEFFGCFILLHAILGCNQDYQPATDHNLSTVEPEFNLYGARQIDTEEALRAVRTAWKNYADSIGFVEQKTKGFTEQEINYIEEETRQKLPEDLKAFLKLLNSNGEYFNEFEIMSADEIVDWWHFLVSINYTNGEPINGSPSGTPTWFQPYMIPLMRNDTNEIHFDIRNGNVIELMDGPCGILAASIVQLLDELAKENRAGNRVTVYSQEGKELRPFLKSEMWKVHDK